MKKVIRLTESDLHNIIEGSVRKVLREEQDKSLLLQSIAQSIVQQGRFDVTLGENDADFDLQGGYYAYVTFEVMGDPYIKRGMRSNDYDVPDDPDEIVDDVKVEVGSIKYCNPNDECIDLMDNGIVKQALEKVISVDYSNMDIPDEDEYFYNYFYDGGD